MVFTRGIMNSYVVYAIILLSSFMFSEAFFTPPMRHNLLSLGSKKQNTASFSTSASVDYDIEVLGSDESSIRRASKFMIDAFWLQPAQVLNGDNGDAVTVSDSVKADLEETQKVDMQEKHGERMGKRMLNSAILAATKSDGEMLGMVCIEVGLFDKHEKVIFKTSESETKLKNAVASLKPKERREYKDSTVAEIATQLLPPEIEAIVILSNLAVSPNARRMGIGTRLCKEVERVVKDDWEFDNIYLRVEAQNAPARQTYEGANLGYKEVFSEPSRTALRVDLEKGSFVEIEVETLTLAKEIS